MTAVLRADALRLPLRDESVDLIITSPPYFALRSYRDADEHYDGQIGSEATPQQFLEALWAVTAECARALKRGGSMFVNLGDKYAGSGGHNNAGISKAGSTLQGTRQQDRGGRDAAERARLVGGGGHGRRAEQRDASRRNAPDAYNKATIGGARPKSLMLLPERYRIGCVDQLGLLARAIIVWSKPNGLPESVNDRVRRSHEDWVHLTREGHYFADVDPIREPHAKGALEKGPRSSYKPGSASGSVTADGGHQRKSDAGLPLNPRGKLPGSVWSIPGEPLRVPEWLGVEHFAAFPQEWPRRLILAWSPPGGVVLDPFGGSGTTAMVARVLGRTGISVDLSADYCRLAQWRVFESGHATKSVNRTFGEAQESFL